METIHPKELLNLWQHEGITPEMAIGHIPQNLINLQLSLDATNTAYFTLRADLEEIRRQLPRTKNNKA